MSALHDALTEYLATRRALGTQLREPESSLRRFVDRIRRQRGLMKLLRGLKRRR
jgi:hypothetical protein